MKPIKESTIDTTSETNNIKDDKSDILDYKPDCKVGFIEQQSIENEPITSQTVTFNELSQSICSRDNILFERFVSVRRV